LEEVMTDFWCNHFNVFADKGLNHIMITSYERDVIRPRALGRFEDLLVATAKSPAMLFYLDNWQSMGPHSLQALGIPAHPGPYARRFPRPSPGKRPSGLNENYGRELLELHTLSVNGGYSQRDVTEAAKVFTGWTIDEPAKGGGFKFEPRMHEPGPKQVLGHRIKPKGESEGMELLHLLASSPQTAHFISLKLAERFVADDPPPALVDRMSKTFLKKKGDIREVLNTLFHSSEFWDEGTYRAKVKTPLEFVASAVRATGAEIDDAQPLVRAVAHHQRGAGPDEATLRPQARDQEQYAASFPDVDLALLGRISYEAPRGFGERGESGQGAAVREAEEETHGKVTQTAPLGPICNNTAFSPHMA